MLLSEENNKEIAQNVLFTNNAQRYNELHIGNCIKQYLETHGQSASWLALQMHCTRNNIYKIFNRKYITTDQLMQISRILQHDFFAYFSKLAADMIEKEKTGDVITNKIIK